MKRFQRFFQKWCRSMQSLWSCPGKRLDRINLYSQPIKFQRTLADERGIWIGFPHVYRRNPVCEFLDINEYPIWRSNAWISWWLHQESMSLWRLAIQLEDIVNFGWAIYSTNQINKEALNMEISKTIGRKVAAKWRIVSTVIHINHNEVAKD